MRKLIVVAATAAALAVLGACGGSSHPTSASSGSATADSIGPTLSGSDSHWHAALGVYDCDHWLGNEGPGLWSWPNPNIDRAGTTTYAGLHSHDDGIIHMEPATQDDTGANATLGRYFTYGGWKVSADGFTFLGTTRKNGDGCHGQPGTVRWWVNGKEQHGDPAQYKLMNDDVIVVAFLPADAKYPGTPPSVKNLPGAAHNEGGAATVPAASDAAGKPCVAVTDSYPAGAPPVPVVVGPAPTKLYVKDIKVGTGPVVSPGATITANYTGVSCSTGKIFDSSYAHGGAVTFPLNQVIPGWTNGLPGMKVGGVRLLGIPPQDGYGAQPPAGSGIAPNETLWFLVEAKAVG